MRVVCELHGTAGYLTATFREGEILGSWGTIDSRQSGRRENVGNLAPDTLSAEIAKDCNRCLLQNRLCGNFI